MIARMGDRHRADRRGLIGRGLIGRGAMLATATALLLAGCGQTGPLYLPDRGEVMTRPPWQPRHPHPRPSADPHRRPSVFPYGSRQGPRVL